ncbi:aminopeptidase N [Thermotomaculum hydrothermale]|uniref:Aminopeptidase N n=1 Tax=Thermotomaculum hydrothermale TaxID=981385 RepID=A0A7R6PDM5_9BACT|nr:M1 family aminopeptidase [Thermotomaculum hydrothermale]BBB31819.1 aminopeptidase N [Thermotomaculum hydrothermale]
MVSAGNLSDFYEKATFPKLQQLNIKTKSFKVADLVVSVKPDSKIYLMLADDEPVGIAVSNASYDYKFGDKFFLPVAVRNFKNTFGDKPNIENGKMVFKDDAEWIFIWSAKIGNALKNRVIPDGAPFPEGVKKVFNGVLGSVPSIGAVYDKIFPQSGIVSVYIHSKKRKLEYFIDPFDALTEEMYAIMPYNSNSVDLKGNYYVAELTSKTLKNSWLDKDNPLFTVVDTKLDVFNDKGDHLIVKSKQRVRINRNNLKGFFTNLISSRYDNEFKYYHAKSVKVDGKNVSFLHKKGRLFVDLGKPYNLGDFVTIETVCEGDIAIHPSGDNYFSLGTYAWYPQPDLDKEKSSFEITVKAPKPYTIFASGNIVDKGEDGDYNYLKTSIDDEVQFPVVAAGKYHVYSKDYNGYKCTVSSYAMAKKKHALRLANNFLVASDYYSRLFGYKYPFKNQEVVEVNSWGFGQAPPGLIFITQEAFSPLRDYLSKLFSQGVNQRFVHEISHAYWGHIAKIPNAKEMWISEALAQYSSALCIKAMYKKKKKGEKVFNKMVKNWYTQTKMLNKGSVLFFAQDLSGESDRDYWDRWKLIYNKGPLVIHAIRLKLQKQYGEKQGDRMFVIFLRAILKNSDFDYVYTKDLIGILNAITKTDWTPFFERYVLGTDIPEV